MDTSTSNSAAVPPPVPARPPLNVALLSTYYHPVIGGVEKNARQIARALVDGGASVTVYTRRTPPDAPAEDQLDGVAIRRLLPRGRRNALGKWAFLPVLLGRLLRQDEPIDVIFCIDVRAVGLAAVAAGRALGIPVVLQPATPGALSCRNWDGHLRQAGIDPEGWLGRLVKRPAQRAYASADAYVCVATDVEREALACGIPAQRLLYIPHGVDLERFRPAAPAERREARTRFGWPIDRPIVLFLGRLSREKGVLDLLGAWSVLDRTDVHLVIVGPEMHGHPLDVGPQARRMVVERGLSDRVTFHGPADDPAPLLRAADVFVQPSHWEAFGISALEALASGLPVVATAVGGMRDFLVHEDTALLCEPSQPTELAAAISRVLANPALAAHLAARGRLAADTRFSERTLAERYRHLFGMLTAQGFDVCDGTVDPVATQAPHEPPRSV